MQTSCFFILRYLDSMIFISGGLGGSCSDFLSLQNLASSEQISYLLFNILSNACFRFRHIYNFVSSESGITLLLLNWKSSFNYFRITKSLICLELAMINVKETKLWSWLNISFSLRYNLIKFLDYNEWNLLYIREQNSRHYDWILKWTVDVDAAEGAGRPRIRLGWSFCCWVGLVTRKKKNLYLLDFNFKISETSNVKTCFQNHKKSKKKFCSLSFRIQKWVSENRDWRRWFIYFFRHDQFLRLFGLCQSCTWSDWRIWSSWCNLMTFVDDVHRFEVWRFQTEVIASALTSKE